jgi:peptidylprolyl isomerase
MHLTPKRVARPPHKIAQMDRRVIALISFSALAVVVVAIVLIGRGGDSDDGSSASTDTSTKPEVEVPEGPPPEELVIEDIVTGDGAEAEAGDQVTVNYVGVDYGTGEQFDASWDRGEEFPFQLGAGQVIPGWDQGVEGMTVGGRRQLIIPPDLAYGPQGQPPDIGPNATLVFVVDLTAVE